MFEKSFLIYYFVLIFRSIVASKVLILKKKTDFKNLRKYHDLNKLRSEAQKKTSKKIIFAWLNKVGDGNNLNNFLLSQDYKRKNLEIDVIMQKIQYCLNDFYILAKLENDLSNEPCKQIIDFNLQKLEGLINFCEEIFSNVDLKQIYSPCFLEDFRFSISFNKIKENLSVFLKKTLCYKEGSNILWQDFQKGMKNSLEYQITGFFYFIYNYPYQKLNIINFTEYNDPIDTDYISYREYVFRREKDTSMDCYIRRLKEDLQSIFFISEIMDKSEDSPISLKLLILEKLKSIQDNYLNYMKIIQNDSGNLSEIECFSIEDFFLNEFRYSDFVAVKREFEVNFKDEKNVDEVDMMVLFLKKNKDHSFFANVFFDRVFDSLYSYNNQKEFFQSDSKEFKINFLTKSKKAESFHSNVSCCSQIEIGLKHAKKSEIVLNFINDDGFSPFIKLNLSSSWLCFSVFGKKSQIMFSCIYFKNSPYFGVLLKTDINSNTKVSISVFSSFLFFASVSFELFADFNFVISFSNQKSRLFLGFLYPLANQNYSVDLHCGYFFE